MFANKFELQYSLLRSPSLSLSFSLTLYLIFDHSLFSLWFLSFCCLGIKKV